MVVIKSVYWTNPELLQEADKIRWRDKKSFSEIVNLALDEYVKHHKDGNEQYTLDDPVICTPSFFREHAVWEKYFNALKPQEEADHKFKIQQLKFLFKKRFGYEP